MPLDKSKCDRPGCPCTGVDEAGWHVSAVSMDMKKMSHEELVQMAENVCNGD